MTQEELASVIELATESYGRIERGLSFPSIPTLLKLSHAYGMPSDSLLDVERKKAPVTHMRPEIRRLADLLTDLDDKSLRQVVRAVRLMVTGTRRSG